MTPEEDRSCSILILIIFSLYLPYEKYIFGELSYEEYKKLEMLKIKPADIPRQLHNKGNIEIRKRRKIKINNLISEDEALGIYK